MNVLEIPGPFTPASGGFTPATGGADLDSVLDRMVHEESGGNPLARSPKGALGLLQIMPATGAMYGVRDPKQLLNPQINRTVAKQYLGDLLKHYNGNMQLALAAYNAGPGRVDKGMVPTSTHGYVQRIMSALGPASAEAAEPPPAGAAAGWTPPPGFTEYKGPGTTPAASTGAAPAAFTPPPGFKEYKSPSAGPTAAPPPASAAPPPERPTPWEVKVADWFPMFGQIGGELGGARVAGYPGNVVGGGLGAGGGALLDNRVRAYYGLPPISVGGQALIGAGTSAAGPLFKYLPIVGRLFAASKEGKAAAKPIEELAEKALASSREDTAREASKQAARSQLGTTLKMTAQDAVKAAGEAAQPLRRAYQWVSEQGLRPIGDAINKVLQPHNSKLIGNSKLVLEFLGRTGRQLEIVGKPLRTALEDLIIGDPQLALRRTVGQWATVKREIGEMIRTLNRDQHGVEIRLLNRLRTAAEEDMERIIGAVDARKLKVLEQMYARRAEMFRTSRALQKAIKLPAAASQIVKHGVGDVERAVEVIREMTQRGRGEILRRGEAARIWQEAEKAGTRDASAQLKALSQAISKYHPRVFDELFGTGARERFLMVAKDLNERVVELIEYPDKAKMVAEKVAEFLKKPGVAGRLAGILGHRVVFGVILAAELGGFYEGRMEGAAVVALGGLLLAGYEKLMQQPWMMNLLLRAAESPSLEGFTRYLIAALTALVSHGLQPEPDQPTDPIPDASPTPAPTTP
jgi:hypothetical protein